MPSALPVQEELIWTDENEPDKIWHQDSNGEIHSLKLMPNKMLLRKCVHDQNKYLIGQSKKANTENDATVNAILQSLETGIDLENMFKLNWCEVLSIGKIIPFTKTRQKMSNVAKHYSHNLEQGDFVVMAERSKSGRRWRGTWGKEYLVIAEIHEPFAMILKKDWAVNE